MINEDKQAVEALIAEVERAPYPAESVGNAIEPRKGESREDFLARRARTIIAKANLWGDEMEGRGRA